MLTKESLTAVTVCGQCGAEMSTVAVCDQCEKRMCMKCGAKHECKEARVAGPTDGGGDGVAGGGGPKDKKEKGRGELHP